MNGTIYFDNAATTRTDERVLEATLPFMREAYGNPSGKYSLGYEARKAVNSAHTSAAQLINAEPDEIYFTSSGTEGNNTIIKSVTDLAGAGTKNIYSTAIEHKSVLNSVNALEGKGARLGLLQPGTDGYVFPEELERKLAGSPKANEGFINGIVSVMLVNNETGSVQPVKELCDIAHRYGYLFHTDAVQAAGHMDINVKEMGADFLTVSGHKLYGPKGTGFIFVKRGIRIKPYMDGGGQERGLRSGTENVPGIVGLGKACEIALSEMKENEKKERETGSFLKQSLLETIPDISFNGTGYRPEIGMYVKEIHINTDSLAFAFEEFLFKDLVDNNHSAVGRGTDNAATACNSPLGNTEEEQLPDANQPCQYNQSPFQQCNTHKLVYGINEDGGNDENQRQGTVRVFINARHTSNKVEQG